MLHYCMIVYFPFLFSNFCFWVCNAYEHCISLEYYSIFHWNTTYWHILPGYSTFQQVYTRYILHITGIPTYHWINITWMVLRGILVSLHFITAWSYSDVYPFYCIYTLYTVYTLHVLPLSYWSSDFTYTKRIHLVYLWYTSLRKRYIVHTTWYIYSPGIQLVYNMYTSGFVQYDHPTFTYSQA